MSTSPSDGYKARKEAFVSNLSGSSLTEINLVTLVAACAVFLWTALQKRQSFFTPYSPVALIADFLLNVCAILFAITLYSSAPLFLSIFLITPGALLLFLSPGASQPRPSDGSAKPAKKSTAFESRSKDVDASTTSEKPALLVRPFLTHYRGSMMVVTCLAILAVDFPIFPRRYAKVETWGTSLMDLGVGSFVFSAGVVSARAIVRTSSNTSFLSRFATALRHSTPLFILGFIRLYSVKGLDYAEHVTEYGVHWNFFFTLALLPPFVEVSDSITRTVFKSYEVLAVILAVVYEVVLNNTRLVSYILISPRGPDLLSKNREGVFSFIGYLAIYLAGRGVGVPLVQFNIHKISTDPDPKLRRQMSRASPTEITHRERFFVLQRLLLGSLAYVALYWFTTSLYTFNLSVSRRLANLPYVIWVVAFNTAQLFLFGLVEEVGPQFSYESFSEDEKDKIRHATSRILRVFNSNGLVVFLIANLLTGLVNLSLNTLDMPPASAMGVLVGYAVTVTGVALGLDLSGVKIKL
ncbi:Glucosaminyl phosphatidylinositol (GlcN-PI) nositol acylation protein [Cladophialophora chaetospira]|uniref:GPI-anchored wall transfer protein n=1 Tax=Cladophialophora chaetospira TaxID=386627 RepID=A0AA38XNK0_9EURO|nr:Glucosaminyl phosphatidylinositol (GlcN-PI) nositol acylation protein [Cladophialophora chaetospira]